jgi:hypothetical protein
MRLFGILANDRWLLSPCHLINDHHNLSGCDGWHWDHLELVPMLSNPAQNPVSCRTGVPHPPYLKVIEEGDRP